ncbi:hypothetical protein EHQ12_07225 [Leptospira gomenensis]|uniref:Glycosyltransferase RgtA/B/C/D-like domain-containing protein n=1 Tax=Leptospira gomenensis TaxID=2484974 RepID=A0A5F1Z150_9LEPT|nr:hypothetical protein [Leptospira gomenensis]TGK35500.1 hypothetical protein EHQ17_06090 [Leptospira gomenensis]TGK40608.1 hypothetical protein EHQ12_07225 [Leptospira gomenensis]TGK46286.1 hypothetical protein EHQ07_06395 [Leptospira gomenensis]TGK66421.1 hypothetical protein EHQ13_02800 [Leptospira gomenensis]
MPNKILRYTIYLIVFFFLAFNRWQLDRFVPFVSSDSEIKYYQTMDFAEKGFSAISSSECFYPGKRYDPDFRNFPFDYPWAFLKKNGDKACSFQYPPVFALLFGIPGYVFGKAIVTFLPLFCMLGCMFLFDSLLSKFVLKPWTILAGTIVPFCLSFPVLSAEEFSEVPLNNLLLFGFAYSVTLTLFRNIVTVKTQDPEKHSYFRILSFASGVFAVTAFFLRTESAFPVFLFGFISFFNADSRRNLPGYLLFSGSGAAAAFCVIGTLNFFHSGHPMGIRFLISSGDAVSQFSLAKQIGIFSGYFLGDATKTGFLKAAPYSVLILGIFYQLFRKRSLTAASLFGFVGFGTLCAISFLSPYTAGVHHFGLRYLESGFLFLSIGIFILMSELARNSRKPGATALFLLVVLSLYFNYKFVREGFKILFASVDAYREIQNEFQKRKIVVHKGQFTNYLIGYSYLNSVHLSVISDKEMEDLERRFVENGVTSYSTLEYDLEPARDPNLPEKQYKEKIAIRISDPKRFSEKTEERKILAFTLKSFRLLSR